MMTMEQNIQKQVQEVNEKVTVMLILLKGNEYDKDDKGIVGQVNDHEERIKKVERWRESITNKVIGIGIGVSLFAGIGLREVIALIFKE